MGETMRNVTVKYIKQDQRTGSYVYRRRVPKILEGMVRKREFITVIGKSLDEAMVRYGQVHQRIEHMINLAKNGVTGLSPSEQAKQLASLLETWGADPRGPGLSPNERTWREEEAGKLVDKYQDPETGKYVGVPEYEGALASALLSGVEQETHEVTVTDAFKFYLQEKEHKIPEQRKKQRQRFERSEKNLTAVLKGDRNLTDVSRADARAWRDQRVKQGVAPGTIRRELNDIRAVFNLANSELGTGNSNPFSGLKLKSSQVSRQDQRLPLPPEVLSGVYADLSVSRSKDAKALSRIWCLLDFTGARPSEVRLLTFEEFVLDAAVPYILIQVREDRTLKTGWSSRKIPLVGDALEIAKGIASEGVGKDYVFPRFASAGGMDRLSTALTKLVRKHSEDPRHVPYSLRHNMKDRMRLAEVFPETARAIEGHAISAGQDGSYGGEFPLEKKRDALLAALYGYSPRRGVLSQDYYYLQ
ncbi:integrase [uncultured Aliiroseovarius sp.]|uniref:tyrosine-type recombinase/integrase n=1 Tax=uncultured Aliiroseovarius sp. TaxID=1658783 RepID=UPI002622C622|nr:integrase [uncultured Aliiroseovarius sp.]